MEECLFVNSPLGWVEILADPKGLKSVRFVKEKGREQSGPTASLAQSQLKEYFKGNRWSFSVPLAPEGTAFQKQVWALLKDIPFGDTRSYGELALKLGNRNKTRAVGLANGQNPIAILIPCHRVIGANGDLTGYAGGLPKKKWLLAHESRQGALF